MRNSTFVALLGFTLAASLLPAAAGAAQAPPMEPLNDAADATSDVEGDAAPAAVTATEELGRRLTPDEASPSVEPLGRIDSRIENRIQNRIRNRVDQHYDPLASSVQSKVEEADTRSRMRGRPR